MWYLTIENRDDTLEYIVLEFESYNELSKILKSIIKLNKNYNYIIGNLNN